MITGGSGGLGKALVEKYNQEDFKVYEFSRSGKSAHHIGCDFSSPSEASQILENTISNLSRKEYSEIVLINNAGTIHPIGPILGFDPETWIDNMNINLNSAIIASGLFIKYFQNHSGKKVITSISSGAAIRAKHGWALYCAAKAGLDHFCRALALEQKAQQYPIHVVLMDPGVMDTDMQAKIRGAKESQFPELQRFVKMKEEGLLLTPESVAQKIFDVVSGEIENGVKYSVED